MIKGSLAKRYARALMAIGQEQGVASRLGEELSRFASLAEEEGELKLMIRTPVITKDVRARVIEAIGQALSFHDIMIRFLKLLNEKGRLPHVAQIARAFQELSDQAAGLARASVISAAPLTPAEEERVKKALSVLTGKEIIMSVEVDPSIIAGVVTRVEGKLLDGSLRAQLKALEERLRTTGAM